MADKEMNVEITADLGQFENAMKTLQNMLNSAKRSADAVGNEGQTAGHKINSGMKQASEGAKDVESELSKMKGKLKSFSSDFKANMSNLASGNLGEVFNDAKSKMGEFFAEFANGVTDLPIVGGMIESLGASLANPFVLAGAAIAACAVAAYKLGRILLENTEFAAEWGAEIDKMARRLGTTTDAMQKWDTIAKMSGTEGEDLAQLFEQMNGALQDMLDPASKTSIIMKQLGVSAKDASGNLKDTTQIMDELFTKMGEYNKDSQAKLSVNLFGEGDSKTALAIIDQYAAKKAQAAQIPIISVDDLKKLAEFRTATGTLSMLWERLKIKLGAMTAPFFTKMTNALTKVVGWIYKVLDAFDMFIKSDIGSKLVEMLNPFVNLIQIIKAWWGAVVTFFNQTIAELSKSFKTWFGGMADDGNSNLKKLVDGFYAAFTFIWNLVKSVYLWIADLWTGVVKVIFDTFGWLINVMDKLLVGDFTGAWQVTWKYIQSLWDAFKGMVGRPLSWAWNAVFGWLQNFGQAHASIISGIANVVASAADSISNIVNTAIDGLNGLIDASNSITSKIPTIGFTIGHVGHVGSLGGGIRYVGNNFSSIMGGLKAANPFVDWGFSSGASSVPSTPKVPKANLDIGNALDKNAAASKGNTGALKDSANKIADNTKAIQTFTGTFGQIFTGRKVFDMFAALQRPAAISKMQYAGVEYSMSQPVKAASVNQFNINATIREEADIRKLAIQLNTLQKKEDRSNGLAYGY